LIWFLHPHLILRNFYNSQTSINWSISTEKRLIFTRRF